MWLQPAFLSSSISYVWSDASYDSSTLCCFDVCPLDDHRGGGFCRILLASSPTSVIRSIPRFQLGSNAIRQTLGAAEMHICVALLHTYPQSTIHREAVIAMVLCSPFSRPNLDSTT
ncbi:hypothetical protein B0H34DRAFT_252769 [Crassisporium funariophilum]|nr:hypothetical protein B0H34DRAFT_252769 [Crassisporium funariophilum]